MAPEYPISRCRSCKAPIIWVLTTATHKPVKHPLDATPDPEGEWIIADSTNGRRMLRYVPMLTSPEEPRYTSHFATCPDADSHRKDRR